jgi:hypothetical protein
MERSLTASNVDSVEKEIINILIESVLYLDLDLVERYRLLHFIEASYFARMPK